MDYGGDTRFSGGNAVQVLSGSLLDQEVWATEDEYRVWSRESSVDTNANYEGKTSQSQFGSDHTKPRNSLPDDMSKPSTRSKSIGKMFHKTKLCCKFRSGTCPYITNCNFAHGFEELRKPPPNWQDIVAAHEEERVGLASMDPKEEFQLPSVAVVESQRSYKGKQCKKFYSGEGCPYGDNCTYLHDEQSKARESDAISLGPNTGGSGYSSNNSPGLIVLKPSNWKTRMCNKWELTGYCPFGSKCHFAHGNEELHGYGGTLLETEDKGSSARVETKLTEVPPPAEAFGGGGGGCGVIPIPHNSDRSFHMGVTSSQSLMMQRAGQRLNLKRKGPDKISKVYGDWIDDL